MQPAKVASAAVYHNIHVKFWNQTNQGKLSISYQNSRTLSDERRTFFPASNRALGLSFLCLQKVLRGQEAPGRGPREEQQGLQRRDRDQRGEVPQALWRVGTCKL